jgi:hypothetical protein
MAALVPANFAANFGERTSNRCGGTTIARSPVLRNGGIPNYLGIFGVFSVGLPREKPYYFEGQRPPTLF